MLHGKLADPKHALVTLIKGCLEYEPVKRPTARQVLERLGEMRAAVCDPYTDLNRLQLERSLREGGTNSASYCKYKLLGLFDGCTESGVCLVSLFRPRRQSWKECAELTRSNWQ